MAGRRRRAQWLILVLLLGTLQATAGGKASPKPLDENPPPSADLLMFLADFDDADGEVLDRAETAAADQRAQPADTQRDDDD